MDNFKFPYVFKSYYILKIDTCKYSYKVQKRGKNDILKGCFY